MAGQKPLKLLVSVRPVHSQPMPSKHTGRALAWYASIQVGSIPTWGSHTIGTFRPRGIVILKGCRYAAR
jgi:hypothetical protein